MSPYRPDPEHDAVLTSEGRHLLVTAPPGTGKTCLSVRLAAAAAASLQPAERVLLLTFSNQARAQLEREADRRLSPDLRARVEITNYHRFFYAMVRAYRRALDLPMELDIGSRGRRRAALAPLGKDNLKALDRHEGLLEALAEHAFEEFRDERTPGTALLEQSLKLVLQEQRSGRLVFDDLGALFWQLVEMYPLVASLLQRRYPMVIADEHQDASALQDAVVRRLSSNGQLAVFADPMQLIHEFRGARPERLAEHEAAGSEQFSLKTPHRWSTATALGDWLLAVRSRLQDQHVDHPFPKGEVQLVRYDAKKSGVLKAQVKYAVLKARAAGCKTICVLAATNHRVSDLRGYLCREGRPVRQVGTWEFEEGRREIELLGSGLAPVQAVTLALERLENLLPTLEGTTIKQARQRVLPDGLNLVKASSVVKPILSAFEPIYQEGTTRYYTALVAALEACAAAGHRSPALDTVRALKFVAESTANSSLETALKAYSSELARQSHVAPKMERGLFVMNVHQAKGKEFDAVVLAEFSKALWPDNPAVRRLLYVALTRAGRSLTVVASDPDPSPLLKFVTG